MSLPNVDGNNSYLPRARGKNQTTPRMAALGLNQGGSFGKAILPNIRNVRNLKLANSTKIGIRGATGQELALRANPGQVTSNRSVGLSGALGTPSYNTQTVSYGGQDWMTFAMQALPTAMQALNTWNASKAANTTTTTTDDTSSGSTTTAENLSARVSSSVSGMKNANNSSELRSAISSAEGDYAKMKGEYDQKKNDAIKAQSKKKDLDLQVEKGSAGVKEQEGVVSQKRNAVTSCKNKLAGLKPDYSQKVEAYSTAQQKTVAAKTNLTNANADLATAQAMPAATVEQQAARTAAIEKAQAAVDAAQTAFDEAKRAEETAKNAKEQAYNALEDGKEAVKQAEDNLTKANEELETAEAELQKRQDALVKAKTDLDAVNNAIDEFRTHTQDMADLEGQINNYKKVLTKMEKDELKEYDKLKKEVGKDDKRNEKLWGKVETSDNNKKNAKNLGKIEQNNSENTDRSERIGYLESSVAQTTLLRSEPTYTDASGNKFRTAKIGDKTYYAYNDEVLTKEEYDAKLRAAKG